MWHNLIKSTFQLPLATHRYLLNDFVNSDHLKKMIIKRFIKFSKSISSSDIPNIRLLHNYQHNDWRSTYGRNYMNITKEAGVYDICLVDPSKITVNPVPPGEEWRINFLSDILSERDRASDVLTPEEIVDMIHSVCCA